MKIEKLHIILNILARGQRYIDELDINSPLVDQIIIGYFRANAMEAPIYSETFFWIKIPESLYSITVSNLVLIYLLHFLLQSCLQDSFKRPTILYDFSIAQQERERELENLHCRDHFWPLTQFLPIYLDELDILESHSLLQIYQFKISAI